MDNFLGRDEALVTSSLAFQSISNLALTFHTLVLKYLNHNSSMSYIKTQIEPIVNSIY